MKKVLLLFALIFVAIISDAGNRTLTIAPGYTMLNPFTLGASDTINAGETITFSITNLQKYMQHQAFTVGLTQVTGTHSITITAAGRINASGAWVTIGTPITWVTSANNGTMVSLDPINYNYLRVTFVEGGTGCQAKITAFQVKTANAYDIPANSGTLTISKATSGTVTVTTKDDDANANTVYRAGGTGTLTVGASTGTTAITSSDWAIGATGNMTGIGDITSDGYANVFKTISTDAEGRVIYGKATISNNFGLSGVSIAAGVFGRVVGTSPTATVSYEGGTYGYYGITGTNASGHPKGGLIGVIGDGTTTADAAVLAVLDGDTGTTTATAAFGVRQCNSTAASGFSYGLDLYSAAIGTYLPVAYKTAQIRLSTGVVVISGAATTRQLILNSGEDAPIGSMYISSGTGGHVYVKVAHTNAVTDWNVITTSAAD